MKLGVSSELLLSDAELFEHEGAHDRRGVEHDRRVHDRVRRVVVLLLAPCRVLLLVPAPVAIELPIPPDVVVTPLVLSVPIVPDSLLCAVILVIPLLELPNNCLVLEMAPLSPELPMVSIVPLKSPLRPLH